MCACVCWTWLLRRCVRACVLHARCLLAALPCWARAALRKQQPRRRAWLCRLSSSCVVIARALHARLSSYWDVLSAPPAGVDVHLVRGELSDRWTPGMLRQLAEAEGAAAEAGRAAAEAGQPGGSFRTHVLERAGHWLQADNPDGLSGLMLPWLRGLHQSNLVV